MSLSSCVKWTIRPVVFLLIAAGLATAATPPASQAAVSCDRYASLSGSDSNPGTFAAPLRSVQRLVDSLGAGRTGCLTGGGVFAGSVTFGSGGASGSPVTLASDPTSPRATIKGVICVQPSAPYVTLDNLRVDATNASQIVAVQLFADYAKLTNSEVFGADQDRIGVQVGYQQTVKGVEIASNRIHDFGVSGIYDHGIYIDLSDGALVHDNYIYDNAGGYGIQLWTHAMNGRIYRNTIDGNGAGSIIIAGQQNASGGPSSGNEIDHNILSNPSSGRNISIFWSSGGPMGEGNTVHDNVYWKGDLDTGSSYCGGSCSGVSYSSNLSVDPTYADRTAKDFSLGSRSPALGYGAAAAAPFPEDAPTASSSILAGATLSGNVKWTVTPSDSVASVEFAVNGATAGAVSGSPATYTLDTTLMPDGAATLSFTLVLADGRRFPQTIGSVTVANVPTNTSLPVVSGFALLGHVLTATLGTWNGNPSGFAYAWRRCDLTGSLCLDIPGAAGAAYTVGLADVGSTLRVAVAATSGTLSATAVSVPTSGIAAGISSIVEGSVLGNVAHWTASPPAGTALVEFWIDGSRVRSLTAGPYAFDLDTTTYANGAHIVGVAWTDALGLRHPAWPATNVTISNVTSSIRSGDVLRGVVAWTATAPAGTATVVEFWLDNRQVAVRNSAPYAYNLYTRRFVNGPHIVGVAWTDSQGVRHPAAPISVSIAN